MTLEEFQFLLTYVGSFGIGAVVTGIVGWLLFRSYLPNYIDQKARNLANKEDIGKITDEVEKVKTEYARSLQDVILQNNVLLEQMKGRHQLRLAAAEQRIQAHQEAFKLWRKIGANVHRNEIHGVITECQEWWENKCLYLSPDARKAFYAAYITAVGYRELDPKVKREEWKHIKEAGEVIVRAAELPSLGLDAEAMFLNEKELP